MRKLIFIVLPIVLLGNSCAKDREYVTNDGLNPNDIIKFTSIMPDSAYADSSSQITIRVSINSNTDSLQTVTLNTNKGIINGKSNSETSSVNLDRYADFVLTSGQVLGPVSLNASVRGYSRDSIINFLKAYPDSIIINPEKFVIEKNTTLPIEINLFRYKGYPSAGQNIFYSATTANGEKAGTVIPDDEFVPGNKINAVFTPNQDLNGDVFITVTVLKEDGSRLKNAAKINIQ